MCSWCPGAVPQQQSALSVRDHRQGLLTTTQWTFSLQPFLRPLCGTALGMPFLC